MMNVVARLALLIVLVLWRPEPVDVPVVVDDLPGVALNQGSRGRSGR